MTTPSKGPLSRRGFLTVAGAAGAGLGIVAAAQAAAPKPAVPAPKAGQQRLFGLRHPPLGKVRVGFIGVGNRGSSLLVNPLLFLKMSM